MLKSLMICDYGGREDICSTPDMLQDVNPKTYEYVEVLTSENGNLAKKMELREVKKKDDIMDYRDFSLQSIIESGNVQMLNPIAPIAECNLDVSDKVGCHADYLESVVNSIPNETNVD